jgi:hypothetical protein
MKEAECQLSARVAELEAELKVAVLRGGEERKAAERAVAHELEAARKSLAGDASRTIEELTVKLSEADLSLQKQQSEFRQ